MGAILITGGFGYVGGRLAQHFAAATQRQVVLGSRTQRGAPWLPGASVATTDWSSIEALQATLNGVDTIVHLAGMNARDCAADPVGALEINALAVARLVEAAARAGVRRLLYMSTAHVYASPLRGELMEAGAAAPAHPYATSHRAGEDVVLGAYRQGRLDGVVVRLSNAFGPPAHPAVDCWSLLVNDICRQALTTGHVQLRSSGQQRRDFITLTDTCRALEHLLQLDASALAGGLFNVGGDWAPTILEMTQRVVTVLMRQGIEPTVRTGPADPGEALDDIRFSIDKLQQTGFSLSRRIDAEIEATVSFCRDNLQALRQ